jgi:hypothetical protein
MDKRGCQHDLRHHAVVRRRRPDGIQQLVDPLSEWNDLHVPARRRVYTFADPATGINGTISMVEGATDDPLTNSSMPTVGLIAIPASGEASLSEHLNRLGFNAVSSFREGTTAQSTPPASVAEKAGGDDDSTILYIWIQEAADSDTVINRVASKLYTLEGIFCIPATRKSRASSRHRTSFLLFFLYML